MLRITRLNPGGRPPALKLEGRLTGQWVEELARVVDLSCKGPGRIVVELEDLAFADESGVALLRQLGAAGAELRGGTAFISALLGAYEP